MHRRARLVLLTPLFAGVLTGPLAMSAAAEDSGHDHDTMQHRTLDMDYRTGTTHSHEQATETSTDTHEHGTAPAKDRPLALLLGTFGGVNGAVVLGAALVRRRERAARAAKLTRRSQRRAIPAEVAQ